MLKRFLASCVAAIIAMFFVGFTCGFILAIEEANADPLIGHDTLAILHPSFSDHRELQKGTALSALHWTFGEDVAPLRQLISRVQPKIVRIHLINTTCVRNQNCGKYEVGYDYTISTFDSAVRNKKKTILSFVAKATKVYHDLSVEFPETKFLISPALEHNLSNQSFRILADTVLSVWPEVQLVNSPMQFPAERYKRAWLEGHGPSAPTYVDINSLDGVDVTDIAVVPWLKRFNKIKVLYVWTRSYNCRNQGPFEDPRARHSCPTRATAELVAHITDARGAAPGSLPGCKSVSFKSPDIWKPLAEDKGTGDPRANLPVLIITAKKTRIDVVGVDGKVKGFLGYYGPYKNTQNRYYSGQTGSGDSGYQFSSGYAYLRQGNVCWKPIITGRRQGDYRG